MTNNLNSSGVEELSCGGSTKAKQSPGKESQEILDKASNESTVAQTFPATEKTADETCEQNIPNKGVSSIASTSIEPRKEENESFKVLNTAVETDPVKGDHSAEPNLTEIGEVSGLVLESRKVERDTSLEQAVTVANKHVRGFCVEGKLSSGDIEDMEIENEKTAEIETVPDETPLKSRGLSGAKISLNEVILEPVSDEAIEKVDEQPLTNEQLDERKKSFLSAEKIPQSGFENDELKDDMHPEMETAECEMPKSRFLSGSKNKIVSERDQDIAQDDLLGVKSEKLEDAEKLKRGLSAVEINQVADVDDTKVPDDFEIATVGDVSETRKLRGLSSVEILTRRASDDEEIRDSEPDYEEEPKPGMPSRFLTSQVFHPTVFPDEETELLSSDPRQGYKRVVEMRPLKDATIQNIHEINKKFYHLSVKRIKEQGEIVVEYRRYGLDAVEVHEVKPGAEYFLENPQQFIEVSREDVKGEESSQLTRYYKHDDPELVRFLSQSGLSNPSDLSRVSKEVEYLTKEPTKFEVSGFLKGCLEYYLNENSEYDVFVKFSTVDSENEEAIEMRRYRSTKAEFRLLEPSETVPSLDFVRFETDFYETSLVFVLKSGKTVHVKRWSNFNDELLNTLVQLDFSMQKDDLILGKTVSKSKKVEVFNDFLMNFMPHEIEYEPCQVEVEITKVIGVKVTETMQSENELQKTEVEIFKLAEDDNLQVSRHTFFTPSPTILTLSQKNLIHKQRGESKVLGSILELKKQLVDGSGRSITNTTRIINPDETIFNSEDVRPLTSFLPESSIFDKLSMAADLDPAPKFLHTCQIDECPSVEFQDPEMVLKFSEKNRFSFEENFDSSGKGERTIVSQSENRNESFALCRNYNCKIQKVLINRTTANYDEKIVEFSFVTKDRNDVSKRNTYWIPIDSKDLPEFFRNKVPLKKSSVGCFFNLPTGDEMSPLSKLMNIKSAPTATELIHHLSAIDIERFEKLDQNELAPSLNEFTACVQIRHLGSISIYETFDGKSRYLVVHRECLENEEKFLMTSYYKTKAPLVRKLTKSNSIQRLLGGLASPERKKKEDDAPKASKMFLALQAEEEPLARPKKLDLTQSAFPPRVQSVEITSKKTENNEKSVKFDEKIENKEIVEACDTPTIGITVKQMKTPEPESKFVLLEKTVVDENSGKPQVQRKKYSVDDSRLLSEIQQDPNAIVVPYDEKAEQNRKIKSESGINRLDKRKLSSNLNISVETDDGIRFCYKFIDGKVVSQEHLDQGPKPKAPVGSSESLLGGEFVLPATQKMASKKRSKNKKPMQKIKRKVLRVVSPESGSRMTLEEALKTNVIDSEMYQSLKDRSTSNIPQTSKPSSVIFDPATQGHMTIEDAQTAGIQIPEAFLHVQPQVLEATSLMERTASMKSLNNSRTALIEEVQTQSQESVKQSMPIVFAHPRKSLLANLVKKVTLIDPITGEKISLDEGRRRGLLDEEIFSEMKQRERIDTGVPITQEEYNQMKENDGKLTISRSSETLYFPETSQIMEKSQFILDLNPQVEISRAIFIEGSPENQVALGDGKVSAEEAYRRGLIDHSAYCDLKEIDDSVELVTIQTTQTVPVRTPMEETNLTPDRERFKFPSAPIINIEDSEAPLVYNSANNSVVSPGEALKIGLIDTPTYNKLMFEVTTLLEPEPIDSDSIVAREQFKLLVKVVLPGSKDLLSPDDAFERGLINSEVLQIIQNTPDKLLDELAEDSRLWSLLHFSVVDKDNSMQIAMDDALALNMINPELYQVIHERANIAENWEDDDLDEEEEDQESETRMVPKGIILITDPETGEQRGLDEAFDSGLIDETRYLELKTEETMGIDELKVSQIQGDIYISHSETSETFSPEEAFSRGLISLEVFQRLRSDVTKNEGIPVVQRRPLPTKIVITAKSTGKSYTLDEALENKLIDKETYDRVINKAFSQNTTVGADLPSVTIQDPVSSQLCTLAEAYRKRIISHSQYKVLKNKEAHPVDFGPEKVVFIPGRVSVVDPTTNDEYSLEEALGLGYFDMESYIELRNASTGKSDLMTLATTGGLNISQDLLAEIDTKRLSRQFSAISLTQILQPKLVHAQIEHFELPMIYNVESKTFYAKNEISKLADVKQLPEIYVYPVNDSDIEISVEDAKNRKLITKEEFSQIELLQISEVNKFCSMLFANLKIEKSATEFISIDEAVESKFITDQQKLEIKSKFNSCICAYRVFALFQQSAKMSVFNPKSEVISEAKVNPSNFGQFPPISVVTKGSADVISLGNAISENIIDREAIEKYLSTLYFDSDYASFLLIYVPDEKMLFPAHQAALREHLTVKGFYEIAQTENRIKTFIKKKERNSETMVSAPEALVNGLVTEETYDRLVQKLPDETSLGSLLVYDPYTKNVHSLEEAYTLGTITFDHVKSVLLNSTTHPRYVSKLSIVDRNQNAMISPELALESKVITSEEFESMFLNFTRGFEKVLSSKIKILNPKTAEIFTIEDAMNLGYTTYEKYCDLSQIAVEVPQGVPSLLVVTDKSELLSPVVGFLEGSITKDIYKNLYHEHVDFLHPLKPSRISVLDPEDGVVRTLEETFSMGLVEPESYSDMLAKLVENSSGCPSLMVRNPEDSQLMTLQEAVEEEVIDPTVIDQIKTEDVFKYKDANTYVIVQNTGEAKLLKDAIAENILSLSEALPMLDAETSADEPLVWESKKRNLLSFDEAVQKGLVPESGFTHPSSRSLLTASQAEAKILVYSKDTDSVVPLKTAKEQNIISANVYEQITKDVQSNPQRLTTVMILDNKGKDCFNIFEAVRRHLLHPEKAKELASKHKNAMQLMKAPELTVYSNEFNREMTLEEAIDQSCIKIENAAVTLEKIETEPESLTKCLIVDEKLGCLTTPQEALAAGTIDIAQLKEIQEAVPSTKAPLKETGILIYVSETQQIMSLFEALTSGAVTNETYEELVAKMKTEPELITKLMILDSHSGYVMTPIAAVDSEILDVELFDEFVELQTELLMPMKSTGISVLHIGTEIVVPIEKSILNGMLSPETYNETLNKFKAGNEFMCKLMMFNPLADQVLTLDDAYKKQIVDAERYNTIASLFPEAFESVRATGLNVFIVPSKRFSTVEEALRHRIIPHTVYQQLLNKLAEEPHRLSKTMLYSTLTEQITSFDEALRNGVLTAEDYKQFYDMHPKETDHLSFSFLILDSDSGKIMSCDDAIRDNFTNDDKLNMVTAQANENPYSVTKVMVVDPKSGDLYTPSEAVSNRCLSPTLFQELRDLHPNAFEGTIPTGITVLLDSEGSEVMMLENAVMAGRLSTGVYETITQSLNEDPSQITKVMVLNPTTGCLMSLRAAFDEDVISNDVYNNFVGSNCECLESIRPCEISVLDNFSGEIIPIEVAVHRGHISSQKYKEVLVELQEFPEAWKKLVLIDDYGELVSPEDALEFGYINEEFYFQLRESFPDGFKPAKHNELKIINLQTEQTMSLTEALKNGDVTPLMYDNLMHALQSSPEKLTKAMTIHPRMPNLMTAQDAVQKGFLTSSKFDELKSKYPGIAKPVFIPTLKVYDVQTDTQYFLKDLIKQDKLSEEAVGAVFETMVRKPEEITKNLLYIDAQNQLISLAEATSRNLIDEEKCAELTKNIPESLEPWSLPSEIRTLDPSCNQLIPLEMVTTRGLLNVEEYAKTTKQLATEPELVGKLVVFNKDKRDAKTLELAIREGEVDQRTLSKLKADKSNVKLNRQPTGLCLYNPDNLTVTPAETSLNAGEISQEVYDQLYETFQKSSAKIPGLLILKSGNILTPSEALSKNLIQPSQVRALQQEYPEAFSPQIASGITILEPSSNKAMPLECALNLGLITPEEYVNVASKVNEDPKSYSTRYVFLDFESKKVEKPHVAIICSTFDPETYMKSIEDSKDKRSEEIEQIENMSMASNSTADLSDIQETVVYDPSTKLFITPTTAASKGLIEDPSTLEGPAQSQTFGVAGVIDQKTKSIVRPSEAVKRGLITSEMCEQLFSSSESLASSVGSSTKPKVEDKPKRKGPSKVTIAKPLVKKPEKRGTAAKAPSTQVNIPKIQQKKSSQQSVGTAGRKPAVSGQKTTKAESPTSSKPVTKTKESVVTTSKKAASRTEPTKVKGLEDFNFNFTQIVSWISSEMLFLEMLWIRLKYIALI